MIKWSFLLSIVSFCFFAGRSNAQQIFKITGTVSDSTENLVEFAQVSLYKNDSIYVQAVITDSSGKFQIAIPQDSYTLTIKRLGQMLFKTTFRLEQDLDFGLIKVKVVRDLSEVVITGRKKLIERKLDRLVFNVESSIASQGVDVVEVLKNTPMVRVDNNGLSLIGKSSLAIMIDSRILNISGEDLINYLKTLRSENVAKIEIITAPPAKYDAVGNSGIINIILKKNSALGWNGNISSSYTQTTYPGYSNSGSLNFQSRKTSFSIKLRQFDRKQKVLEQSDLIGNNSVFNINERKDNSSGIGGNVSIDYNLTKNTDIGFIYDISKTHNDKSIFNVATYRTGTLTDSILTTPSTQQNPTLSQTFSFYYDIHLDTTGRKLSFGGNYFSNQPDRVSDLQTFSGDAVAPEIIKNTSNMDYSIWSGQIDLTLLAKWANIEMGTKYARFINNSDVKYLNYENQIYQIDFSRSNRFNYTEDNIAAYFNANKKISDKWSTQLGLRYEYASVDAYSPTTSEINKYNYGNLFPTAYLQYKLDDNNVFNINYSKRINRPGFSVLNPFRWYANPYTYSSGNPLLTPSFNQNVELNYLYKGLFTITLYGQKTINGFGGITRFNNGIKQLTFENYLTQYNVGLTTTLDWNPVNWWENYISVVSYYSTSKSAIRDIIPVNGLSTSFSVNNAITLDQKKSFFLLLNYFQNLPSKEVNVYSQGISNLSIGLKYALFNKRLFINGIVEDAYKGSVGKGEIYYQDFIQDFSNYYDNRRFTISMSYNFGKKNIKGNNRQIKFNEKSRAN